MPGSAPSPLPPPFDQRPFSTSVALRAGVSARRLRSKTLFRPYFGVRAHDDPTRLDERAAAFATRLKADQSFSHLTAAALWRLPLPARLATNDLHVTTPGRQRSTRAAGTVGHRSIRPVRIVGLRGVPVTDPVRTMIDLAAVLTLDELVILGDAMVATSGGPASGDALASLEALVVAVSTPCRIPGLRTARDAVALVRVGSASAAETSLRLLIVRSGLPEPSLNQKVYGDGRYLGRGDFVYWDARIVIEYEGDHHRVSRDQWRHDLRRRERFEDAGWRVVRATGDDLGSSSGEFCERLARLLAERGRS